MAFALALSSLTSSAFARTSVSVDLHFGDRYRGPDVVFYDDPDVIVVPGTRVYYVRDYDYDIYRCGRFWYYNYDGGWYRARSYRGPWIYVGYRSVPREISYVPQRYRRHWRDFRAEPRYTYRDSRYRERGWLDRDRDARDRDRGAQNDRGVQNRDRGGQNDRGAQNRDRRDRDRNDREWDGRQDR
jgi:hypothetical protein